MDIRKTAGEIGLFETAVNLSRVAGSEAVTLKAGAWMPLPDSEVTGRTKAAARWLVGLGKKKYLFLTPEIALIEEMGRAGGGSLEIAVMIPCGMDGEARERVRNNLPRGVCVETLEEPYFPADYYPGDSAIVTCGYTAGDRLMVLSDTYRLVEHYSGFQGRKVFVPYAVLDEARRFDGWYEISRFQFTEEWREAA